MLNTSATARSALIVMSTRGGGEANKYVQRPSVFKTGRNSTPAQAPEARRHERRSASGGSRALTMSESTSRETLALSHEASAHLPAAIEQSRRTVGGTPDLMCTHDLDGRILSASPAFCEVMGRSQAGLRGTIIRELLPQRDAAGFDAYLHSVMRDSFATG